MQLTHEVFVVVLLARFDFELLGFHVLRAPVLLEGGYKCTASLDFEREGVKLHVRILGLTKTGSYVFPGPSTLDGGAGFQISAGSVEQIVLQMAEAR